MEAGETEIEARNGCHEGNHRKHLLLPTCLARFARSNGGSRILWLGLVEKELALLHTSESLSSSSIALVAMSDIKDLSMSERLVG
ncbi:Homeobox-leucine zipper protein ROC8 [Senna tora]|uniref:Homeobox-leucine zipper protein ROC8 n=1 Tax=Senna tora TaxID=362788 RepID=A0A834T0J6_9FABA|nr:Homeobox-leucine zipper protein ROC8 [Senna tora]